MTACAAFSKESRMGFANANKLHRKSGGAKPRDLQFSAVSRPTRLELIPKVLVINVVVILHFLRLH
jgi:hypothetical protein